MTVFLFRLKPAVCAGTRGSTPPQKNKWGIKDNLFERCFDDRKEDTSDICSRSQTACKDGVHLRCNLNDFCPGEKSGFIEQYRTSRTQFLQWLGFEEAKVDSDRDKLQDGNTPDKEMDGKAKVQVEREECQGSHIKVHIDNLIEPLENLLVRPINQEHVSAIADSFQGSFYHFTTLLGLVDRGCSINSLAEPGAVKVQVLGGNHTRAALQLLGGKTEHRKDKGHKHVIMDVYEGLSEEQCLHVGYSHNEIHEKSRKMNFQEKVAFFHRLLEKKKMSMHNKSLKVIAVSWRADISTFTRKTQTSLKQPRKETDGDETKNQKQKKMKSTCMDLEGDNEEVPSRKVILKQNRSNEEHSKMQRECEEGKGSEGTEQELAIVEYNHQKFYLGILSDENTFIFCKEPIA